MECFIKNMNLAKLSKSVFTFDTASSWGLCLELPAYCLAAPGGDCAQGAGLLGLPQLAVGGVEGARGDPGAVGACAVGCLRCGLVGLQACQAGPVCGVKDGVGELARSTPALEAHFLGDVASGCLCRRKSSASRRRRFRWNSCASRCRRSSSGMVCAADGLVWMVWDGDFRYGFNSFLRTIYLGWRLV